MARDQVPGVGDLPAVAGRREPQAQRSLRARPHRRPPGGPAAQGREAADAGLAKDELRRHSTLMRESDPNYQAARGPCRQAARRPRRRAHEPGRDRQGPRPPPQGRAGSAARRAAAVGDLDHRQTATKQLHGELFSKLKQAEIQLNLEKVSAESRYRRHAPVLELPPKRAVLVLSAAGSGLLPGLVAAVFSSCCERGAQLVSQALATERRPCRCRRLRLAVRACSVPAIAAATAA